MNILTISGSLKATSFNTGLLRTLAQIAPEGIVVSEASIADIPLFNEDLETAGLPPAVATLKQQIAEADGVIISTPEYNFSYSGVLKNAIDWASRGPVRPFAEKPVATLSVSPGNFGGIRAQTDLRRLMHSIGAHVLPKPEIAIPQAKLKFDDDRRLTDEATHAMLTAMLEKFSMFIRTHASQSAE